MDHERAIPLGHILHEKHFREAEGEHRSSQRFKPPLYVGSTVQQTAAGRSKFGAISTTIMSSYAKAGLLVRLFCEAAWLGALLFLSVVQGLRTTSGPLCPG